MKCRSRFFLNAHQIKQIAIIMMVLDHIAWAFVPFDSILGQGMHTLGRMTAPIMCFFIAEGYQYTHNLKRYMLRLLTFALLSQIPYALYHEQSFLKLDFNIIFNLLLGLMVIAIWDRVKDPLRQGALLLVCFLAALLCDWSIFAPAWCLCFWIWREEPEKRRKGFVAIAFFYGILQFSSLLSGGLSFLLAVLLSLFCFGTCLTLPVFQLYNGNRGRSKSMKWVFYLFYPGHLLVLALWKAIL